MKINKLLKRILIIFISVLIVMIIDKSFSLKGFGYTTLSEQNWVNADNLYNHRTNTTNDVDGHDGYYEFDYENHSGFIGTSDKNKSKFCSEEGQNNAWHYIKKLVQETSSYSQIAYILSYTYKNNSETDIWSKVSDDFYNNWAKAEYIEILSSGHSDNYYHWHNVYALVQWAWWRCTESSTNQNSRNDIYEATKINAINAGKTDTEAKNAGEIALVTCNETHKDSNNNVIECNGSGAKFTECSGVENANKLFDQGLNYQNAISEILDTNTGELDKNKINISQKSDYTIDYDSANSKYTISGFSASGCSSCKTLTGGDGYTSGDILVYEIPTNDSLKITVILENGETRTITRNCPTSLSNFSIDIPERIENSQVTKVSGVGFSIKYLKCSVKYTKYDFANIVNNYFYSGQNITQVDEYQRQYIIDTVDYTFDIDLYKNATISINKIAYDGDGATELTAAQLKSSSKFGTEQYFNFTTQFSGTKVYKKNATGVYTEINSISKSLKAGETKTITVYWKATDNDPSYTIAETVDSNWEIVSISNSSGTLSGDASISVEAKNKVKTFKGSLTIHKDAYNYNEEIVNNHPNVKNQEFKYTLAVENIRKNFVKSNETNEYTIKPGQTHSYTFTWFSYDQPTYEVTETDIPDNWELIGYENDSGSLEQDNEIAVIIKNKAKLREGYIKISKITVDEYGNEIFKEDILKRYGKEVSFKFDVRVTDVMQNDETSDKFVDAYIVDEGEYDETKRTTTINVEIQPKSANGTGGSATVGPFKWNSYENPTYTVTELNNENWTQEWHEKTGNLEDNKTIELSEKNTHIEPNSGKITINKKIGEKSAYDERFTFKIDISNHIKQDEDKKVISIVNSTEEATIEIAKGSQTGTYETGTYSWYEDEVPSYVVKEVKAERKINGNWVDVTSEYTPTINHGEGTLTDGTLVEINGGKKVYNNTVVAFNDDIAEPNSGKISISKKLTQTANYDQKFKFKVTIEGARDANGLELGTVTLNPEITVSAKKDKGNTTWTSGDYYWKSYEEAPTYTIEEEGADGYNAVINPATGKLSNKEVIEVTATNVRYENHIELNKTVSTPATKDEVFKFKVTVSNLHDKKGNDLESKVEYVTVKVAAGAITGTSYWSDSEDTVGTRTQSNTYEWWNTTKVVENDLVPKYTVEEIETEDSVEYNPVITPASGTLADNGVGVAIKVDAVNNKDPRYVRLQLKKKLTETMNESATFKFHVEVKGVGIDYKKDVSLIVDANQIYANDIWESEWFKWNEGDPAPTYTVTEYVDSDKFTLVSLSDELENKAADGSTTISGTFIDSVAKVMVTAENDPKIDDHEGSLKFEKKLEEGQTSDKTFNFKLKVEGAGIEDEDTIELKAGQQSSTYEYKWKGDTAPTYTISEVDSDGNVITDHVRWSDSQGNESSTGVITGSLISNGTVTATCTNDLENRGKLTVIKELKDGQISDETFKFNIHVEGAANSDKDIQIDLKAGEEGGPFEYIWYGDKAPTYEVTEIDENGNTITNHVTWENATGKLTADGEAKVTATCENYIDDHQGKIKVTKNLISDEKLSQAKLKEDYAKNNFGIKVTIKGSFIYNGVKYGKNYDKDSLTLTGEINYKEPVFESENITWYGDVAPKYYIEEYDIPDNWEFYSINYVNVEKTYFEQDSSRGYVLNENKNNVCQNNVKITNKYDDDGPVDLGGIVWLDGIQDMKTETGGTPDGEYQDGEVLKENVKVYVYNADGYDSGDKKLADLTNNGVKVSYPILTKSDGSWYISDVPKNKTYVVEFMYDGQNYTSTKVVTSKNNGSKANEVSNNSTGITNIYGGSEINENGDTKGYVEYNGTERMISYKSENAGNENPVKSKLVTTNEEGLTIDMFEATATTKNAGYTVNSGDTHVNLGLKARDKTDVKLTKRLSQAKVSVKGYEDIYNYNTDYNLTEASEEKQNSLMKKVKTGTNANDVEFTLGLYKTGYYYRAEVYNTLHNNIYNQIVNSANTEVLDEIEVELTYTITVYNDATNTVTINSIDDYFESSLEYVSVSKGTSSGVSQYEIKEDNNTKIKYNKMTITGLGMSIASGKSNSVKATYRVMHNKENNENYENGVKLGLKSNIAEIGSYSAGNGIIDRDSAPGNISISEFNSINWYEDDTEAAPKVYVTIEDEGVPNEISGTVWEDNGKDSNTSEVGVGNQKVGNGKKDSGENTIKGLNTQLVEKIYAKNNDGTYTQYDFVWPTDDDSISGLNGKTINELYGFDSEIKTGNNGKYTYSNIPSGEYVVRFLYGDSSKEKVESTASYSTSKYYNGQDFKSGTYYKASGEYDYISVDEEITESPSKIQNVANDSEVRRLEVINLSRNLTYANTSIMGNYSDELFENYYMWADTPRINTNNIAISKKDGKDVRYLNNICFCLEERPATELTLDKQIEELELTTSDGRTILKAVYNISYDTEGNASVVLNEEKSYGTDNLQALNRDSATNQGFRYINVDDEILQGAMITVKYRFTVINHGEIDRSGCGLYVKRSGDEYVLCSSSVSGSEQVKLSEYDYDQSLEKVCMALGKAVATFNADMTNNTKIGKMIGSVYYYGAKSKLRLDTGEEPVVKSRIRNLVDYVDTDVTFDSSINIDKNTSWTAVTSSQLYNDGLIGSEVVTWIETDDVSHTKKTDENNNFVINDNKNKEYKDIAESVDNTSINESLTRKTAPNETSDLPYINMTINQYVGVDTMDLDIDNLTEIIKYSNDVGRRDMLTIAGNANSIKVYENVHERERDTSVTETITISPPTGMPMWLWRLELAMATLAGLAIIAGGIIIIKKKVLKK